MLVRASRFKSGRAHPAAARNRGPALVALEVRGGTGRRLRSGVGCRASRLDFGSRARRSESGSRNHACLVVMAAHRHGKAVVGVRFSEQALAFGRVVVISETTQINRAPCRRGAAG